MNNNLEIKAAIEENKKSIKTILEERKNVFELNPTLMTLKENIIELQNYCSHMNEKNEYQYENNRCIYCGKLRG